ncbi:type II 3-dehydroquinate dehydratase [Aestuariivita sp.]|jgi:3-dehydroquinate dehydratase-2|uniref:type II 3-dehydroquinate dehydratase n=1 Tax=Aestuariivita sp. TaxID=1872407 RepID=UPI00216C0711|nr:type II 3-dehydroquinate dehydratase [Aestuariivita sp.]MCE8005705.1 type II 3-dehydroquinate dehydratase [Aestuariivita sp.]
MTSVLLLNGPNLNLLGTRQPEVYGTTTLPQIEAMCEAHATPWGWRLASLQSNHEGVLIDALHDAQGVHDGIILNAGGYTHTSIALMDAISSVGLPVVEVHLSDIHAREPFRQISYISRVAIAQICGQGPQGYLQALDTLRVHFKAEHPS